MRSSSLWRQNEIPEAGTALGAAPVRSSSLWRYKGTSKALLVALGGSPIPKVPWRTKVRVTSNGKSVDLPVIDLGPAKKTGNAIDLTIAAARLFDPSATATRFEMRCDYRILGGAKYLQNT